VDGNDGRLGVDPRALGQREARLTATPENFGAESPPQLRQQHAERPVGVRGCRLLPRGGDQRVAGQRTMPVDYQVGQQQTALAARERTLDPATGDPHGHPAAEVSDEDLLAMAEEA